MKTILIIVTVFFGGAIHAQQDSGFLLVRSYQGDIAGAAMDNLDNLYILSSKGQVKKFNANGDSAGVYNQVRNYGKLFSIDVSNPLKILLFYKDFSTVVVLDRFLAVVNTLDLRKFSILQPASVGLSYDNNMLVYDEYDNKLKKIDEQGSLLMETPDFRTVFSESISPQKILNTDGFVFLADSSNGVYVFDNYGSFKRRIPLLQWQSIAVSNHNLVSTTNEFITVFNTATLLQTQRKIPFFKPYFHSFTSSNKLVVFSGEALQIYQYRQ